MDFLDSEPCFMDELLNFSSDVDEEENKPKRAPASSLKPNGLSVGPADSVRPWNNHELVEEELEWLSNKDSFPAVEPFMAILSDSPVSVLDGSTITFAAAAARICSSSSLTSCFSGLPSPPRRARTRRRCRRRQCWFGGNASDAAKAAEKPKKKKKAGVGEMTGRKCLHCGADKTPQWRAGPHGPKTLCNACGVRYKSGRLVPEYRPASSPSFSTELHSNSHRKIMEMRRIKQVEGLVVRQPLEPECNSNV